MKCLKCSSENRNNARYCNNCGQPVHSISTNILDSKVDESTSPSLKIDLRLQNSRYILQKLLVQSREGATFLAIDRQQDDRLVVIKRQTSDTTDLIKIQEEQQNFKRRITHLICLNHPLLPKVIDGFEEGSHYFMVQEYVTGESLEAYMERLKQPMQEHDALKYGAQVLDVLDYLAQQTPPIVHGDIKPANILISARDKQAHLVGFDLLSAVATRYAHRKQVKVLKRIGYAPPEKYWGNADPRSDLYALAATLHHLLSNRDSRDHTPFAYPPIRTLNEQLSLEVELLLSRALNNDINQRYQTAVAMKRAINLILSGRKGTVCYSCGEENRADAHYCHSCGQLINSSGLKEVTASHSPADSSHLQEGSHPSQPIDQQTSQTANLSAILSSPSTPDHSSSKVNISSPDQLVLGIVRILKANKEVAGTGFLVSENGLIATCSHVIQNERSQKDGERKPEKVTVVFQATGDERDAQVVPEWWLPWDKGDLAVLRLEGALPKGVGPLPLGSAGGTSGHEICSFGFPNIGEFEGLGGDGRVVRVLSNAGKSFLQLQSNEITEGFSGAPIWDKLRRRVIGTIYAIQDPDPHHRLSVTAFATSTETLQAVCPALRISEICPYRGLDPFTEHDSEFFFGRQHAIDGLLNRLRREPRFLTILGPSGSGKSSLIQAGLIPQLKRGKVPGSRRWKIMVAHPDNNPFDQLAKQGLVDVPDDLVLSAQAYLKQHTQQERLMIILDQFEELFIMPPETIRQKFITQLNQLLHSSLPISIVLVMRDDFYSRLTQQEALVEWLEQSQGAIHIPRTLTQEELRAIVQRPAEDVGLIYEEGLIDTIVKDALEISLQSDNGSHVGRSETLPLLEFALTELWKLRDEGVLTHEAYHDVGGVAGAITQWADGALHALKSEDRRLAQRILTDLVYIGDEAHGIVDSRRRRTLVSLCRNSAEQIAVQGVVQHFVEHHLLVTDRDLQSNEETVDIIHDALLREWGQLRAWIDNDYHFLKWHQKLEERVQEWSETDPYHPERRDVDKLLGKRDLEMAKEWQKKRKEDLGLPEHTFIEKSEQRQRKLVNRRRILFTSLSILSIIAIVLASVAEINFQRAQAQGQLAASRQLAMQATNQLDDNPDLALLLSVEANHIGNTLEAKDSLLKALEHQPHLAAFLPNSGVGAMSIAFSPDGKMLAVGGQNQTFTLWDVASRRPLFPAIHDQLYTFGAKDPEGPVPVPVNSLTFSPDGKVLATGTDFFGGTFRLWNVASRQPLSPPIAVPRGVSALAFAPRGELLAVACTDGTFELWNVAKQRLLGTHRSWGEANYAHELHAHLAFSPDGNVLAVDNNDVAFTVPARFTLWNVKSQRLLAAHSTDGSSGSSLAFSPNGKILAVGGDNGSATLWDVNLQRPLGTPLMNTTVSKSDVFTPGSIPDATFVAFNPTGRILAVGSGSRGPIVLWDVAKRQAIDQITTSYSLADMAFSSNGNLLVTMGNNNSVSLWYTNPTQPLASLLVGAGEPALPQVRPDGTVIGGVYLGGYDTTISQDGHTIAVEYCHGGYYGTSCTIPTIRLWSARNYQQLGKAFTGLPLGLPDAQDTPNIALNPDSKFLAVAGCATLSCTYGQLNIWNVATHQIFGSPIFTNLPLKEVAYSSDGKVLAAYGDIAGDSPPPGYNGGVISLWDVATGRLIGSISSIVGSFVFKPGSDALAAHYCSHFAQNGCDHVQVGIWDARNPGNRMQIIDDAAKALFFNPAGTTLAALDYNTSGDSVTLWDVASGKRIRAFNVSSPLWAFTPDGSMFVSGTNYCTLFNSCTGSTIQLLDVDTLHPVGPPLPVYINYAVEGVQVTQSANPLYGWSVRTGMVVSWNFNVDSWQTLACQMANRNLTESEWKQFMGSMPYHKTCLSLPEPSDKA